MKVTGVELSMSPAVSAPPVQPVAHPAAERAPDAMLKGIAVPAATRAETPDIATVEKAASRMEEHARSVGRSLQFRVDEDSGRVVVSVRDPSTGELIRQIPSESVLRIAQDLGASDSPLSSLIIDGSA